MQILLQKMSSKLLAFVVPLRSVLRIGSIVLHLKSRSCSSLCVSSGFRNYSAIGKKNNQPGSLACFSSTRRHFSEKKDKKSKEIKEYYSQFEEDFEEEDQTVEWIKPAEDILPISRKRGVRGVFDIEELCLLLREEKALDLCCVKVPPEAAYAEYVLVCSAFSVRHMAALSQTVNKVYKMKMNTGDPYPAIEGKDDSDWTALDLGNIVLHILMPEARRKYDIEQLWAVGPKFDELTLMTASEAQTFASLESWLNQAKTENEPGVDVQN